MDDVSSDRLGCRPPANYAIDPVLGRIALAADLPVPQSVRVTYHYAFSADMRQPTESIRTV